MDWQEKYNIIYFNLFSSYYDHLPRDLREKYIKSGVWRKLARVLKVILYDLKNSVWGKSNPSLLPRKKWIIVDAVNNLQSVSDIFSNKPDDSIYFTYSTRFSKIDRKVILFDFSWRIAHMWRMMAFILLNSSRVKGRWDFFLSESGWYESSRRFLKTHKPSSILFTNDQTPINRAMILAARSLNIKTGYIQHASVRDDFGELLVNYAFLDGRDAVSKYGVYGNRFNTKIYLIGMPKIAGYLHLRTNAKEIKNIGIAFNITDDINDVIILVERLQQAKFNIIVRPHPKDYRYLKPMKNVVIDNPNENNSFTFLSKIDALIAGESAIHLESILLNKPSFQYDFNANSSIHDLYGFLKNDLIREYKTPDKLLEGIYQFNSAPLDVYKKGIYYNSMVDHPLETEVAQLAFEKIDELLFSAG